MLNSSKDSHFGKFWVALSVFFFNVFVPDFFTIFGLVEILHSIILFHAKLSNNSHPSEFRPVLALLIFLAHGEKKTTYYSR